MHPGVRAPGPVDHDPLPSGEAGERGLELSLDRACSRLELEAREVRSVIFDPCPEPPLARGSHEGILSDPR
jgi:hypothetical protein